MFIVTALPMKYQFHTLQNQDSYVGLTPMFYSTGDQRLDIVQKNTARL